MTSLVCEAQGHENFFFLLLLMFFYFFPSHFPRRRKISSLVFFLKKFLNILFETLEKPETNDFKKYFL